MTKHRWNADSTGNLACNLVLAGLATAINGVPLARLLAVPSIAGTLADDQPALNV